MTVTPRRGPAPLLVILVAILLPILARNWILPRRPAPPTAPSVPSTPAPSSRSQAAESPSAALPAPDRPAPQEESDLRIPVDEAHLFEGEINRRGKPVGFHSRPG
jgi:hypothetical protein